MEDVRSGRGRSDVDIARIATKDNGRCRMECRVVILWTELGKHQRGESLRPGSLV